MPDTRYGVVMCAVMLATAASASGKETPGEEEARRMFVGVVPLSLRQGLIAIDGEQMLSPKLSARIGVRFGAGLFKTGGNAGEGDNANLGMGLEPGLRYYLTGTVLDGLWIGPHLELSRVWFSAESMGGLGQVTSSNRSWSMGLGALMGYSMVVSRGFTVQAGVGLGASYSSTRSTIRDTTNPDQPQEFPFHTRSWGFAERATLAVGWAF